MRNGNHAISVCHALWYCYFRLNLSIELAIWESRIFPFFVSLYLLYLSHLYKLQIVAVSTLVLEM